MTEPLEHAAAPADLLATGEIEIEGRLPWSSNFTFLVRVSDGTNELRAVYKPGKGERPLHDFGPALYRREVAAYELSAAFELDLVPETVLRMDGPLDAGSVQRFVDAEFEEHYFTLLERGELHGRLRELAGFDVLINNADRKSGHVLVDPAGGIWGIDNGLSFHCDPKLRTVIWEFAGEPLPERILGVCHELVASGPPGPVAALLDDEDCEALVERARRLCERPVLPAPRDEYRSYPWPLV